MERIGRLLLVVVVVLLSTRFAHATDPSFDVGVCKIEGAPGCELLDGAIIVGNQSTEYYYKLNLNITCNPIRCTREQCGVVRSKDNVILAPKFCTPTQNPGCFDQLPCTFNNCPLWGACDTCQTCDNDLDDCGTEDQLCSGVTGAATGIAWSTDGATWTAFENQPVVPATTHCSGGNSCD